LGETFTFRREPVESVGGVKPFEVRLAGDRIFSILDPVGDEAKPILFERHRYWGEPVPGDYARVLAKIHSHM